MFCAILISSNQSAVLIYPPHPHNNNLLSTLKLMLVITLPFRSLEPFNEGNLLKRKIFHFELPYFALKVIQKKLYAKRPNFTA